MEKSITIDDVRVTITEDKNYGYFELGETEYDYIEGGLWFENNELVDYDGCYILPLRVGQIIKQLGYKIDLDSSCK